MRSLSPLPYSFSFQRSLSCLSLDLVCARARPCVQGWSKPEVVRNVALPLEGKGGDGAFTSFRRASPCLSRENSDPGARRPGLHHALNLASHLTLLCLFSVHPEGSSNFLPPACWGPLGFMLFLWIREATVDPDVACLQRFCYFLAFLHHALVWPGSEPSPLK